MFSYIHFNARDWLFKAGLADCIYILRTVGVEDNGKSRGRGEKDRRNPGGEVIRDQNQGDGLQLKPFSIWQ
jgi:hypothetical protein